MLRSEPHLEASQPPRAPAPRTVAILPVWARWGLVFPLIILNGWLLLLVLRYFQPLVTIVLAATLLSFVLDYPARLFQRLGLRRGYAVTGVFLLAFVLLGTLGVTLAPVLIGQLTELVNRLPLWLDSGRQQLLLVLQEWDIAQNLPDDVTGFLSKLLTSSATQLAAQLSGRLQSLTGQVFVLAFSTLDRVINVILTLVITAYLMLFGESLWNGIFCWFPTQLGNQVRRSLNQNFHNYFMGQIVLALVLGGALTFTFLVLRVPFGLLFGLGIGLMTLIPVGGIVSIVVVSFLIALQNFGLGLEVLGLAVLISQINDNFIAPRVLGGMTGLNPVWILVSLLIGVKLGGLIGLLLAVPLASFIKTMAEMLRENGSLSGDVA